MVSSYIPRSLEPVVQKAVSEFPAVALSGPRQAGKTTLLKRLFSGSYRYVSVESPDIRAIAAEDPRGFLAAHPPPVILDEVQYAPGLLPYVKERIDADRGRTGQYVLTGSQHLLLVEKITESLAGRAAMLRLLPLSFREIRGEPWARLPWEAEAQPGPPPPGPGATGAAARLAHGALWEALVRGGYPELVANPGRDIALWHGSYVQTYLERDVRALRQVGDLTQFQAFLRALAARSGQLLSLTGLARDLGVAVNTIKAWLSVLEASHQVTILRPYFANVGKRLVKTPKVYFNDVGTLCYLSGLNHPAHAAAGPLGGPILETAVLSEIVRTFAHRGQEPRVYFWRTSAGEEVDLVVEAGAKLIPIEVKLSATPRPAMALSIKAFRAALGERAESGYVIHPGDIRLPLGSDATALPFAEL